MPVLFPLIAFLVYGIALFVGSVVAGVGFRIGWDWAGRRSGGNRHA